MTGRWWKVAGVLALVPLVQVPAQQPVHAATRQVTAGDAVDLRAEISAAVDGDVIEIPAGLYELPCTVPEEQSNVSGDLDIINKSITLSGPAAGTATIRPESGCGERVIDIIDFGTPNAVVIERLTISGGRPSSTGGGINSSFSTATTLTIRDSIITDNEAGDGGVGDAPSGGGVYLNSLGTLVIEGSTISNNSVGRGGGTGAASARGWKAGGGGIAFRGFGTPTGTVTITSSTISGNTGGVAALGGGGGLWLDSTDVTLTDVVISNNRLPSERAVGTGAGMVVSPRVPAPIGLAITGGTVSGNTIEPPGSGAAADTFGGNGGGVAVIAPTGTLSIDGTVFRGNTAGTGTGESSGGSGGHLHVDGFAGAFTTPMAITLDGVTLDDGRAGDSDTGNGGSGGGAFLAPPTSGSTITITESTITANRAGRGGESSDGGAGGGVYARLAPTGTIGAITVTNSRFERNVAGDGATGSPGATGADGGSGGGAFLLTLNDNGPTPQVEVTGSQFVDNEAGDGGTGATTGGRGGNGGGLAVNADRSEISGTEFRGNTSGAGGIGALAGSGGAGGGAWINGDDAVVTDSTFTSNRTGAGGTATASFGGGGGHGAGLAADVNGDVTITTSTFASNATGDGGDAGGVDSIGRGGSGGFGGGADIDHNNPAGTVVISDVTMRMNATGDGGDSGDVTMSTSGPGGYGGGLSVRGSGPIDIEIARSSFVDNHTGDGGTGRFGTSAFGGFGGGIHVTASNRSSALDITETVVAGNTTGNGSTATEAGGAAWPGGSGGGVYAAVGSVTAGNADAGTISIARSSITGNTTGDGATGGPGGANSRGGEGGGAWLRAGGGSGGSIVVSDSTIAGNITGSDPGGSTPSGDGGGLHILDTASVAIAASTITDNDGLNGDELLTDVDVTLTANVFGTPPNVPNRENCRIVPPATATSGGYNVETNGDTCGLTAATDATDIDGVVLGPLQDNGAVGLSRLPRLLGSAAPLVDRILGAPCPTASDQLGTSRPQGIACDVGAVEVTLPPITAIDDVIRVGAGTTTLPFLDNDDLGGFTTGDVVVTITSPNSDGVVLEDGEWRFRSPQRSGAYRTFTYRACLGSGTSSCDDAVVTLIPQVTSRFVSLPPNRIFDTRPAEAAPGPKGFVAADSTIDVQITGVAGIPSSGVSAVAMNVTATGTDGAGFVTVFPTGSPRPLASNLNVTGPSGTIPNFVIVPVGNGGKVSMYSKSGTHLLADVAGYFTETGVSTDPANPGATAGRLVPLTPQRVFDTRPGEAAPGPKGFLSPDATIDVQIAGRAGVPATGAAAVVMNLTAAASSGPGFVTAFPTGTSRPLASNLNLTGPGQTTPNLVIVPLGTDGRISLYTKSGLHLLGDVTGYITDETATRSLSGLFAPSEPSRAFDTREGESPPGSKGLVNADETRSVRFTANAGTPAARVGAVVMNATAIRAAAPGFVTVWPDGQPQPVASTLNLSFAGQTRPNAAILPVGDGGRINFFSLRSVDLLADVFGWFLE